MDAVQFIYEARRRYNVTGIVCSVLCDSYTPESIVKELEEWCKEHTPKTRQTKFLKEWPDTALDGNGVIAIEPCTLNRKFHDVDCDYADCAACRKEFWTIEEWSAAHPRKTRQDIFLGQYPNVVMSKIEPVINILPCSIHKTVRTMRPCIKDCDDCRREFWMQEVE